jgi:hypothetical protein
MRKSNFSLRLQPSLMEEARRAAEAEGVALNQLINVAVAEKVSALRAEKYFQERADRADRAETMKILVRAGKANSPEPGDELPKDPSQASPEAASEKTETKHPPDGKDDGKTVKVYGRANPQFGELKRRLDRMRGL